MAYKMKPNKSVMSRFKVTKTGKLKRHHAKTSHLMSVKTGEKKRKLGRSAVLCETIAGNMRRLMCVSHKNPKRTAHQRRVAAARKAVEAAPAQA